MSRPPIIYSEDVHSASDGESYSVRWESRDTKFSRGLRLRVPTNSSNIKLQLPLTYHRWRGLSLRLPMHPVGGVSASACLLLLEGFKPPLAYLTPLFLRNSTGTVSAAGC